MKTIGLIGAQNSHAKDFCTALNAQGRHPGYRITCVYGGDDPAAAEALCREFGLEACVSEEEAIARCDAVVITYRKGSLHYGPAMKALRAGKAVFNDKPFTTDPAQARQLCDYAKDNGGLLCGGSNLKDLPEIRASAGKIEPGDSLVISFAADAASPYDGYWFYGIHAAELCLALCGTDYSGVTAFKNGDTVVSVVAYPDRQCVLTTAPSAVQLRLAMARQGTVKSDSISLEYHGVGADILVRMMEGEKPLYDVDFHARAVALTAEIMAAAGL